MRQTEQLKPGMTNLLPFLHWINRSALYTLMGMITVTTCLLPQRTVAQPAAPSAQQNYLPDFSKHKEKSQEDAVSTRMWGVRLREVNKITARSTLSDLPIGKHGWIGPLEIWAEKCWTAPPFKRPEHAVLLHIVEHPPEEKAEEEPVPVFTGWMFASTPSLSAMEHPVYDITLVECLATPPEIMEESEEKTDAPADPPAAAAATAEEEPMSAEAAPDTPPEESPPPPAAPDEE